MRPRLSDLTWESLEFRINGIAAGDVRNHLVSTVMRRAGVAPGATCKDGSVLKAVEAWITDVRPAAYLAMAQDIGTHRRCDARLLALAHARGVNANALAVLAAAIEGPAGVDVGEAQYDERQISVRQEDAFDEIMVPLDRDVYWAGRHLLIRSGTLPDTALTAAIGREASDLVAHPSLTGAGRIVALEEDTGIGAFDILRMDEAPLPWREAVAGLLRQEAA